MSLLTLSQVFQGMILHIREEIPDLGQRLNYNLTLDFTLTDNLSIKPSINYSKLKKLNQRNIFLMAI